MLDYPKARSQMGHLTPFEETVQRFDKGIRVKHTQLLFSPVDLYPR
jgi:hypothetical protein